MRRYFLSIPLLLILTSSAFAGSPVSPRFPGSDDPKTKTPVKRLVVIFQENVSFDHYFATYPSAKNPPEEHTRFKAFPGTPEANVLTGELIKDNPNSVKPFRLDRDRAVTCSPGHGYTGEQLAYDAGKLDKFVEALGPGYLVCNGAVVMGYYDGNTVTALWNYAQHFAMSDNFFGSNFGPSTPGAINLISGQTHGAVYGPSIGASEVIDGTVIGDPDPELDDCSAREKVRMTGKNIGDLLNSKNITWGWFQGGFRPSEMSDNNGRAVCGSYHLSGWKPVPDYVPHHEPFQYYESTANPHHLPPGGTAEIGRNGPANHQYDLKDFWNAVAAGAIPSVSFLKAAAYQDGHPGYSNPLEEQAFIADTINRLQNAIQWKDMAVIIAYDDSGGWYDHVMPPILNPSKSAADALTAPGVCKAGNPSFQGRCGLGPRLPLLVISPYARRNFIDHTLTEQASVLKFIEDNWGLGRIGGGSFDGRAGTLENLFDWNKQDERPLFLSPSSGTPIMKP